MVTVSELAKITALAPEEVEEDVKELQGGRTGSHVFPMKKDTYVWHRSSQESMTEAIRKELESIPQRSSVPAWYTKGGSAYALYEAGQAKCI